MSASLPALERGLAILERLADAGAPVPFTVLLEELALPKATLARLLKVLRATGHIEKTPAGYRPGGRVDRLAAGGDIRLRLRTAGRPVLEELARETENTALLFHLHPAQTQSLEKVLHPESIVMQEIGSVDTNLFNAPWGWLAYAHLDKPARAQARARCAPLPLSQRKLARHVNFIEAHGFAYDDADFFRGVRRLAAPVQDRPGELVAALVIGGTTYTIPEKKIHPLGETLKRYAARVFPGRTRWSGRDENA